MPELPYRPDPKPTKSQWLDSQDGGSYILHAFVFAVAFLSLCWPYLIWHGHDANGGWRWDGSSWIACGIWWGVLLLLAALSRGGPLAQHGTALRRALANRFPAQDPRDYSYPNPQKDDD